MAANPFQSEIKIDLPNPNRQKATVALSPTGDIQLVTGREKLVTQMVRAIVSERVFTGDVVNSNTSSDRAMKALVVNVFRNFRSNLVKYVNSSDPDLTGYSIWRKASGTNEDYARVSSRAVTYKFIDTGLENGTQYIYGLSRIYKDVFESQFIETFTATPTAFTKNQEWISGSVYSAIPGNAMVTIYVDYNRQFMASELLEKILDTQVMQSNQDPRKWIVYLQIEDYLGAPVNISSLIGSSG